ncbi:hypothetical protein CMUS01_14531 [Colletotrichum musicola]|uniref:Uncharacterized protein n=1 Tax=Colletotrichum musicola TaxID=2175873 RepID=A0A8H6J3J5_9PEZI|nr:hypothetical protein CMUS01_14531 [Colletotrichum musicola]
MAKLTGAESGLKGRVGDDPSGGDAASAPIAAAWPESTPEVRRYCLQIGQLPKQEAGGLLQRTVAAVMHPQKLQQFAARIVGHRDRETSEGKGWISLDTQRETMIPSGSRECVPILLSPESSPEVLCLIIPRWLQAVLMSFNDGSGLCEVRLCCGVISPKVQSDPEVVLMSFRSDSTRAGSRSWNVRAARRLNLAIHAVSPKPLRTYGARPSGLGHRALPYISYAYGVRNTSGHGIGLRPVEPFVSRSGRSFMPLRAPEAHTLESVTTRGLNSDPAEAYM